jgi:hypothetical protein
MPSEKSIKAGLSLIESDKSKILNLTIGNHENIKPGVYIPRAGQTPYHNTTVKIS